MLEEGSFRGRTADYFWLLFLGVIAFIVRIKRLLYIYLKKKYYIITIINLLNIIYINYNYLFSKYLYIYIYIFFYYYFYIYKK